MKKILALFWANAAHKSVRSSPLNTKLKLMDRCCRSQFDFRNTRWPPTKTQYNREDGLQRKLIAMLQRTQPRAGESIEDFHVRRRRLASETASRKGTWSSRHVQRCLDWRSHLERPQNQNSWPALVLKSEDAEWIAIMRALRRQGTGTRAHAGPPHARWEEALRKAEVNRRRERNPPSSGGFII